MSRREKERKASLDALAKLAYSVGGGAPAAPPRPQERASSLPPPPPRPAPAKPAPAKSAAPADVAAERARRAKLEERRAKLEEERLLRERRAGELARSRNLPWRGMSLGDVPVGVRRTAFDRVEPSVSQKITDVLGEAREKEGRAKNRDRGARAGGRGRK